MSQEHIKDMELVQQSVDISRWADEEGELTANRAIILDSWDTSTRERAGIEIMLVSELDELIETLQAERDWLSKGDGNG